MLQIAIYGKGGIGKSTISANISYLLTRQGLKVLQIGCDPKHDSTRLLLGGKIQNTVLQYLREVPKEHRQLSDVVSTGSGGVRCIEAGGPEPGVGCAGRGILTMFDFLDTNGIDQENFDVKLYDVLGDVVCGGFAVPLRKDYADAVFIVTSGEFMSLYAANNILKGLHNYDDGRPRVAGIILNGRGMDGEYEYVKNFADGVGLPIITMIERDPKFAEAEAEGKTISEMFPDSDSVRALESVAKRVVKMIDDRSVLSFPHPLDDETMDKVAKGIHIEPSEANGYRRVRNPVSDRRSLQSCAGMGGVAYSANVDGVHTIVHGPASCCYMMCNYSDMSTDDRDLLGTMDLIWNRVTSTNLDNHSSVFGGITVLEDHIRQCYAHGDRVIFVVSMCVPGIIGDNIVDCCARMSEELGIDCRAIPVDGIGIGGVDKGMVCVVREMMSLADPVADEDKDPCLINIIGDYRAGSDYLAYMDESVEEMFALAGFKVNSIYPGRTNLQQIRNWTRAKYGVRTMGSSQMRETCDMICEMTGTIQMKQGIPRSMGTIDLWLDEVHELTGRDVTEAKRIMREKYEAAIAPYRSRVRGRKVLVVTRPANNYQWFYDLMDDLGVEVLKTREMTYNRWVMGTDLSLEKEEYFSEMIESDFEEFHPDLVLSDSQSDMHLGFRCRTIGQPSPGIAGIEMYVKRLAYMFDTPLKEGWL